jgi:lactoylglutathione lyase
MAARPLTGAGRFRMMCRQRFPRRTLRAYDARMTHYLHTMIRVSDPDATIAFFKLIGLHETHRTDSEKGRFSLIFLAAPGQEGIAEIELTHNWDESGYTGGRNMGHIAFRVDDIYATCAALMAAGHTILRPPRDGHMAFVKTPDGISIELLQEGDLPPQEPWVSMENVGSW